MNMRDKFYQKKDEVKMLDLETFGEIMDKVIHESKVGILVCKEANSDDWKVKGAGCGAVMDFYIFLNAMIPIYRQMLEDMQGEMDKELLANSLADLMREGLLAAGEEQEGGAGT